MFNILKRNISAQFVYEDGLIFQMDCVDFLKVIKSNSVDLIFADPPYNIKKTEWDQFKDQDEYIKWSTKWIKEASRVLKKDGTLYICGFSEILADLKRPSMKYFEKCKWLIWHYENKANLRNDWGRSHESILCLRKSNEFTFNVDDVRIPYNAHTLKYPERAQGKTSQYKSNNDGNYQWSPNPLGAKPKDVFNIPTTCNGMLEKTNHPTQKPEILLRKLVLASSKEGDIIVDPFSGSGTTAVVSRQLKRRFIVNDLSQDYNSWAAKRIENVNIKSKDYWIDYDKKVSIRRNRIK